MDQEEYEGLIHRLEAQAENDPKRFRAQVFLISNCAYIALALIFIACFTLLYWAYQWQQTRYGSTAILIGLVISIVSAFWVTLKAFLVRFSAPTGYVLTPKNAPVLFEVLAKMRKKLKGPVFHHVVVDHEFNAAISQVPRWGLFGGYKNHLVIGLPYLFGVSPQEALATIAHEYGHVAGNHGKLGAWVYRQRITFGELSDHLEKSKDDGLIESIIYSLIDKLSPYFNAYTFVLSRQNEYEADSTATQLVGAKANAIGLVRDALLGNWYNREFWPALYKQANTRIEPAFKPYANMQKIFAGNYDTWATPTKLQAAWRVQSDLHDTHPCLSDRVLATGEKPTLPPPINESAASRFLGSLAYKIADEFDNSWWNSEKTNWQTYHKRASTSRAKIQTLSQVTSDSLSLLDLHELAMLSVEFDTAEKAKKLLGLLLARPDGTFSKAEFEYGKILLNEKNEVGIGHIEKAALSDKTLTEDCAHIGYYYLLDNKSEATANAWWQKIYSQ